MTTLYLVRHGATDTAGKVLTGWSRGVHLNEAGRRQAEALVDRFEGARLDAVYASPLERCRETAAPLARARGLGVAVRRGLIETGYGEWSGRSLAQLRRTRIWRTAMRTPSAIRFPGGESLLEVQARTVAAVEEIAARHANVAVAIVSHADPIRLFLLHAAGAPLDALHRWHLDPASVSVVAVGPDGSTRLLTVNDTGELPKGPPRRRGRPRKVGG
jgi:probable phosphoglycerate mutase